MASEADTKLVMWVIIGLVIFWAIAIPAVVLGGPSNRR